MLRTENSFVIQSVDESSTDDSDSDTPKTQDNESVTTPLLQPQAGASQDLGKSPYDQPVWVQLFMLFCVSFMTFGSYFAHDAVSALESPIKEELGINAVQFGLLSSIYTFPNIAFVLVGGVIIDRMGNRFSAMLFCGLAAIGSAIVALACEIQSWPLLLAGRFLFGIGAESSYVVQNNICIEWFSNSKYFGLAMGITLTIARLGSILAFTTVTQVADFMGNYHYGLWFGWVLCSFSLVTGFLFCVTDKFLKRKAQFQEKGAPSSLCVDPRVMSKYYYLWVLIAVLIYSAIYPFQGTAGEYIAKKWDISDSEANNYLGYISIVALVLSPPFGLLVDFTGKKGLLIAISLAMALGSFLMMAITNLDPLVPILLLGVHFALMPAALWPAMAFIVEEKYCGFGYAFVSALMNASLTGAYTLSGHVVEEYGFTWFCLMFAGLSGFAFFVSIIWNVMDLFKKEPVLNTKSRPAEEVIPDIKAHVQTPSGPSEKVEEPHGSGAFFTGSGRYLIPNTGSSRYFVPTTTGASGKYLLPGSGRYNYRLPPGGSSKYLAGSGRYPVQDPAPSARSNRNISAKRLDHEVHKATQQQQTQQIDPTTLKKKMFALLEEDPEFKKEVWNLFEKERLQKLQQQEEKHETSTQPAEHQTSGNSHLLTITVNGSLIDEEKGLTPPQSQQAFANFATLIQKTENASSNNNAGAVEPSEQNQESSM